MEITEDTIEFAGANLLEKYGLEVTVDRKRGRVFIKDGMNLAHLVKDGYKILVVKPKGNNTNNDLDSHSG